MESQKPQQPRGAREYGQLQRGDGRRSQEVVHVVTQLGLKKLQNCSFMGGEPGLGEEGQP